MQCPLCKSGSKAAFEAHGYLVLDCEKCGHRFAGIAADEAHVSATYADEYFSGGGAGYSDYLEDSELLIARGKWYAEKLKPFTSPGRMLDVGAAAGFVLKGFAGSGWSGIGLEPNGAMAEYGRTQLALDVRQGALETFETEEIFDLVSLIQVVAHFYDVRAAFEKVAAVTKPGGFMLVETWDRESLSAKIFGKNWHEYSPPSVLHWFSKNSLAEFVKEFGFEKVAGGRPSKKISGKHARSLLAHKVGASFLRHGLKLVPENVNFPYPAEDLFWALYQKKK
jgi:SAM-dependent methyltransferase